MGKFKQLDTTIKEERTKVIFRKFPNGEIIALFPELPGTNDVSTCLNYMHIGQHGSGKATLDGTKKANWLEHGDLYIELTRLGYHLKTVSRFSYQMDQKTYCSYETLTVNCYQLP
jgi:hypothetical protein